jgi:hypothetical protein
MPGGVRFFVVYAFLVLALIALVLPGVVAMAEQMPITGPGLVLMLLLAYTIFTLTLVLQRKRAALGLAIGLSSLTVPLVLAMVVSAAYPLALGAAAVAGGLFFGLSRPASRRYFDQE